MTINPNTSRYKRIKNQEYLFCEAGGAGGNAINGMIDNSLQGAEFIAVNTDAQDLKLSKNAKVLNRIKFNKGIRCWS